MLRLNVEPVPGATIQETAALMVALANKLDVMVCMNFNGIRVVAKAGATPLNVTERYRQSIELQQKKTTTMATTMAEWADPALITQVRRAMAYYENNGFFEEAVAMGPEGLRDDLMNNVAVIGRADPEAVLVAVRSYLVGLPK